jgi:hypothetical protein
VNARINTTVKEPKMADHHSGRFKREVHGTRRWSARSIAPTRKTLQAVRMCMNKHAK